MAWEHEHQFLPAVYLFIEQNRTIAAINPPERERTVAVGWEIRVQEKWDVLNPFAFFLV